MIKLAIPTKGNMVDDHFGHCEYFSIIELNDNKEVTGKFERESSKSCGCKTNLAEELANEGVSILLAGGIGQGAIDKLKEYNIQVLAGFKGTIAEAIEKWKTNKYTFDIPICVEHHNCSH